MTRKLFIKNGIVNTVLIYIFSLVPSWHIAGAGKVAVCIGLIVLLTVLVTFIDLLIMEG